MRPAAIRIIVAVLLVLPGTALPAAEEPVDPPARPDGAVPFAGHHYLVVDEPEVLSWTAGREQCAAWGGTLAVVTTPEEAAFVAGLADGRYLFLGASDAAEEGAWRWVDGTPWEFTFWMDGQPNDYGGSEDYLATYDDGEWVDVEHEGRAFWMPTGFLCEWGR